MTQEEYCDWCGGDHPTDSHDTGRVILVATGKTTVMFDGSEVMGTPVRGCDCPVEDVNQGIHYNECTPERPWRRRKP